MKTFGYLRVSGKGQVDGDGPERQQLAISVFCKDRELDPPTMVFEAAVSGTVEAMDRPKFSELLLAIEALPEAACIVVERMDRLARDLMVSEILLAECRRRNIPVYATDQPGLQDMASNAGDPTRVLFRQILGALAQWEKSALVHKLRAARDRKRSATGRCEGVPPFGATPEEASARRIMLTDRASGTSYADIARKANSLGLKSRTGRPWTRGSVWQALEGHKPPA